MARKGPAHMATSTATAQETIEAIKRSPAQKVKVAICDIDGVLRGKYLHKDKFLGAVSGGFGFCNVVFGWDMHDACYDACAYTGWHTGYPDAVARVDLGTRRAIPWEQDLPFFLGDFSSAEGKDVVGCPRSLLKRVLARAGSAGFAAKIGMEFEWFNFSETPKSLEAKRFTAIEPLSPGMFGYSLIRVGQNREFFTAIMDEMLAFGVPIEGLHTETGPGVFEAAILYSDALEAADRAALFKTSVKEIGARFGIMPSFMAKWNAKLPGCSGHVHQSLWDAAGTRNLFHDPADALGMSATYKSYVAGLLRALPEILPMFAPTVNSYKRLVDGYWAPTKPTWGVDNRTVAFRHIMGGAKATRMESRVPGSDVNPYLAVAATIAAGLHGVERKLALDAPPIVGSAYASPIERLPRTLLEAATRMRESALAKELFGADFVEHYTASRLWEWRQFQDAVTDWELQRYFEII